MANANAGTVVDNATGESLQSYPSKPNAKRLSTERGSSRRGESHNAERDTSDIWEAKRIVKLELRNITLEDKLSRK